MSPIELLCALVAAVGIALVLTELPWFRRAPLAGRLRPYAPPTTAGSVRTTASDRASWRAVLLPLADQVGARVARLLGLHDDLALRLTRAGMTIDAAAFRMRQVVHLVLGLGVGAITALVLSPGPLFSVVLVLGSPIVWVLIDEQQVSWRAAERNRRLGLELPVIAEQLGILLSGGWSLPSAIRRIGDRGRGVAAEDLRTVSRRIRQGRSETEALFRWSEDANHDGVRRLVAVLSMHREASDLGALISAEARAIRAESHRQLVESLERRAQLVWVPVTVATLVPGLLFLAVPFMSAISRVSGGG